MADVNGKMWLTRMYKDEETSTEEQLEVHHFPEGVAPANVNVKMGMTLNLGNYESMRLDAGVSLPCFAEETEGAFTAAWERCEVELRKQVAEVRAEQGSD